MIAMMLPDNTARMLEIAMSANRMMRTTQTTESRKVLESLVMTHPTTRIRIPRMIPPMLRVRMLESPTAKCSPF